MIQSADVSRIELIEKCTPDCKVTLQSGVSFSDNLSLNYETIDKSFTLVVWQVPALTLTLVTDHVAPDKSEKLLPECFEQDRRFVFLRAERI